jgi:hypothetical protein
MDISQGNSLCFLYFKQAKMFFILFFLFFFLLQNRRTRGQNKCSGRRAGTSWGERWWGKGVGGWKQCKKMCTNVSKCKKWYLLKQLQELGGSEGEWLRGWIHVWYIWYIVRTCVNAIMHPYSSQQKPKKQRKKKKHNYVIYILSLFLTSQKHTKVQE